MSDLTPCWPGHAPCGACEGCVDSNALEPELPEIDITAEVTETEVWVQAKLEDVTATLAFPNDGHDRVAAVAFLLQVFPQILNQLEAE